MKKLLIIAILMLALVFTAVACNDDPVTEDTTLGDTTVETPTEAPTAEPEDPTEPTETTAEPEETTEEPEETTEEPEETTEEETTEEVTTPDPADPVLMLDPEALNTLAGAGTPNVSQLGSTEIITEGGKTFVRWTAAGGDPYVAILPLGSSAALPQYMAISYRTNSAVEGQFFVGSGAGWSGAGDSFMVTWTEGEWSFVIVDLTQTGVTSITDGILTYARMDFFAGDSAEGDYFDVQYVGFFNTAEYALAYDFEMTKAPMWDENKDVVMHQNFDQFYLGDGHQDDAVNNNLNFYHAVNKPDWDKVADITASDYNALTYWGWIVLASETVGQFGYQVNMDAPIFDDAWTHATEQPVIDAAINAGGATGTRMKIAINTTDFDGETKVRVLYKDAEGNTVCLNEITVIAPVKAKDITDTFVSDLASNAAGTAINATDLTNRFTANLNLGSYATSETAYSLDGISEIFADVNGKYALTVNFVDGRNGNYYAFARGVHALETNATEGVNFTIKNFYETDGSPSDMGGAGIYARIEGELLKIVVKTYDGSIAARIKNVYYELPCTGTALTLADDGEVVYILVDGTTYATIALSGEVEYDGFANISPVTTFAQTAVVTLIDGTTETLENTLIDSTCDTQTGLVVRAGNILFDSLTLTGFSAVENPGFKPEEPETPDEPTVEYYEDLEVPQSDWVISGHVTTILSPENKDEYPNHYPMVAAGGIQSGALLYQGSIYLGNLDLSKYSKVVVMWGHDNSAATINKYNANANNRFALVTANKGAGTMSPAEDTIIAAATYELKGWGVTALEIDLSEIDYSGDVYLTNDSLEGCFALVYSIEFIGAEIPAAPVEPEA